MNFCCPKYNNIYILTDQQIKAILDLRLHRLTSLEIDDIRKDLENIILDIKKYLDILNSRSILLNEIICKNLLLI